MGWEAYSPFPSLFWALPLNMGSYTCEECYGCVWGGATGGYSGWIITVSHNSRMLGDSLVQRLSG